MDLPPDGVMQGELHLEDSDLINHITDKTCFMTADAIRSRYGKGAMIMASFSPAFQRSSHNCAMKVIFQPVFLGCVLALGGSVAWGAAVQDLEVKAEGHTWTYHLHVPLVSGGLNPHKSGGDKWWCQLAAESGGHLCWRNPVVDFGAHGVSGCGKARKYGFQAALLAMHGFVAQEHGVGGVTGAAAGQHVWIRTARRSRRCRFA
jgi:hypothetical protein